MVITVCQRGNVRSVTASTILKDYGMHNDVFPLGLETTSPEVLKSLMSLADSVLLVGTVDAAPLLNPWSNKVTLLDIGRDGWGKAMHPEMIECIIGELETKTTLLSGPTRWDKETYLNLVRQVYGMERHDLSRA